MPTTQIMIWPAKALHKIYIIDFKGRRRHNHNKKMCVLKTESSMHIEVFYKRFDNYER